MVSWEACPKWERHSGRITGSGSGLIGNVGPETITHMVFRNNRPSGVHIRPRNPVPAMGGTAPEPLTAAKLFAPNAFRKDLQRAITADDYAAIVMRDLRCNGRRPHCAGWGVGVNCWSP